HLAMDHVERSADFALGEGLPDADDRSQPEAYGCVHLVPDRGVGLAEVLAALAVTDDHPAASGLEQHGSADFAGECTLRFRMQILSAELDAAAKELGSYRGQCSERRRDHHLD